MKFKRLLCNRCPTSSRPAHTPLTSRGMVYKLSGSYGPLELKYDQMLIVAQ